MSKFEIKKATKSQSKLRMAIHGPSGSGKTYSALSIGCNMGKVCLLDTECGSASKYGDKFDFGVYEFTENYHPERLIEFLDEVPRAGYDVIIVDSMTHFWNGSGGFLELVDEEVRKMSAKGRKPDSFGAWKSVDPIYKKMVHAIHTCRAHVIVTLRAKTEYAKEDNGRGGTAIKKLGLAPEMRDNFQYEMDVEAMLSIEHDLAIGKTRCDKLDGMVFAKPGADVADILNAWLSDGAPMVEPVQAPPAVGEVKPHTLGESYISRFAACSTRAEVDALAVEVGQNKEKLNGDRDRVVKARNDAVERIKAEAQNGATP
jgi:hypothetical protein